MSKQYQRLITFTCVLLYWYNEEMEGMKRGLKNFTASMRTYIHQMVLKWIGFLTSEYCPLHSETSELSFTVKKYGLKT